MKNHYKKLPKAFAEHPRRPLPAANIHISPFWEEDRSTPWST